MKFERKSKKPVRGDHFKTRFRKTFDVLMDEEEQRLSMAKSEIISYRTYVLSYLECENQDIRI